ncbi:MAG: two-component regulator propeller domain-containing protein [Bacteroidota bacterium]
MKTQTPNFSGGSVIFKRLSIDQGLSTRNIRCITQDSRGFIWVGTDVGVNRFNGEKFIQFPIGTDSTNLSPAGVWGGICADLDGVVWVGTDRGLHKFNPLTRSFKRYKHDPKNRGSISSNGINCLCIDREGTLWVGTADGLNKFDKKTETWTRFYPHSDTGLNASDNYISTLLEDQNGTLWIGTGGRSDQYTGGGLFVFDRSSGRFSPFGPRTGINAMFEDRSGQFWVSLVGPRLCTVNRSRGIFTNISLPPRDPGNPRLQGIMGISEDKSGSLWMATRGWNLLRYEKHTNTFTRFSYDPNNSESISGSGLNSVFTDRDGLIWVGTDRAGVNTVSPKPFLHLHTLGKSFRLLSRIDMVLQDREGFLWVGSQANGLWKYNPKNGIAACVLPKAAVRRAVEDDEGNIWFADRFSVYKYESNTKRVKTVWEEPKIRGKQDMFTAMIIDRDKNLWLGCRSSLYRLNRDLKNYQLFVHDPRDDRSITAGYVHSIAQDQTGKIWIGTELGLNQFEPASGTFKHFRYDKKDSSSLNLNQLPRLHIDKKGALWVGAQAGLFKFNENTSTFTQIKPRNGSLKFITFVQEDKKGSFWYARSGGFLVKFNPTESSLVSFNRSDGIEDVEMLPASHTAMKNGELAFGTIDGILFFHPDSLKKSTSVPPIVITGIKKLNQPVGLKITPELLREISFVHEENVFSISYSVLSYDMPEYNLYAYKLEGFDKDWVPCGNKKEVMYTNLDPGRYTFRVKGANHDGVWNEAGASLTVIVKPAWWQTAWFTALVWISVISAVGGTVRFVAVRRLQQRIAQLEQEKAIERDRARISRDLHDEIGSNLSEIAILSSLGKRKPKEAQARLEEISERAGSVIENLGEIVWAINPKNDTLDNLFSRIRRYTVNYLGLAKIPCVCSVPDSIPSAPLSAEMRRNIFLVVKEALHNVVKYSRASQVSFDLMYHNNTITIIVADNGKGFILSEKIDSGNGLGNMKRRMEDIGGTISIETAPDSGTRISLNVAARQIPQHKIPNSTD